jgi:hypothetical protein
MRTEGTARRPPDVTAGVPATGHPRYRPRGWGVGRAVSLSTPAVVLRIDTAASTHARRARSGNCLPETKTPEA